MSSVAKNKAAQRIKLAVIRYQRGHHESEYAKQLLLKDIKRACDDAVYDGLLMEAECDALVTKTIEAWPG